MPELINDEKPTARTYHTCGGCRRTISPGETYRRSTYVGDDGIYRFKECVHCEAFMSMYGSQIDYDGDGISWWDIDEWEPETPAAVEHKRRWSIGWRHGRDLYPIPEKGECRA